MGSGLGRLIDLAILGELSYLCYLFAQVSLLAFILHAVLLFAFSVYVSIDWSGRHLVSPFWYYAYVAAIGVACGCALFLTVIDLLVATYTFPLFPLALSLLYVTVAGILIRSIFKLKVLTGAVMFERRRRRYWELRE